MRTLPSNSWPSRFLTLSFGGTGGTGGAGGGGGGGRGGTPPGGSNATVLVAMLVGTVESHVKTCVVSSPVTRTAAAVASPGMVMSHRTRVAAVEAGGAIG